MRQHLLALLAATALATAVPAVAAAQSINERQEMLDARIDAGVRSGSLTRSEAAQLRAEFSDLARLETRYRANGLSAWERDDLDRRFDVLAQRVRVERNDRDERDDRGYGSIDERQRQLDTRIDAGVRSGALTSSEASQLRAEFSDLARLESRYRADGLSAAERADLDRRFDMLSQRIRVERSDRDDDRGDRGDRVGGNINERQRELEARIEEGQRNRTLTRYEAGQLRTELDALARIEEQYRASGGLSQVERQYLDRRLSLLERRVSTERSDDDQRWERLDARQAQFDRQLDQAVSERRLSPRQAENLRVEFRAIVRLERQYRSSPPGITQAERLELNRRFDRMEANLNAVSSPSDNLLQMLFGLIQQPR